MCGVLKYHSRNLHQQLCEPICSEEFELFYDDMLYYRVRWCAVLQFLPPPPYVCLIPVQRPPVRPCDLTMYQTNPGILYNLPNNNPSSSHKGETCKQESSIVACLSQGVPVFQLAGTQAKSTLQTVRRLQFRTLVDDIPPTRTNLYAQSWLQEYRLPEVEQRGPLHASLV